MVGDRFVPVVGFCDEQVGSRGQVLERIGPGGVAGIGDGAPVNSQPKAKRRGAARVMHLTGCDLYVADRYRGACRQFHDVDVEPAADRTRFRKQHFHRLGEAAGQAGPAMVSGASRFENCASRMKKGRPPKWSPCRCDTNTDATPPGSRPSRLSAVSDVAPQSTRNAGFSWRLNVKACLQPSAAAEGVARSGAGNRDLTGQPRLPCTLSVHCRPAVAAVVSFLSGADVTMY